MLKNTNYYKIFYIISKGERKKSAAVLVWLFLAMIFETIGLSIIIPTVGIIADPDFIDTKPFFSPIKDVVETLAPPSITIIAMGILIAIFLLKTVVIGYATLVQMKFACDAQARISERLFKMYLSQPYEFHLHNNSALLIRTCINDVNVFTFNVLIPGLTFLTELLVLPSITLLIFIIDPLNGGIILTFLILFGLLFHALSKTYISRLGRVRQENDGLRIKHLQQGISGVKEVKVSGRESDFLSEYSRYNSKSAQAGQLHLTIQQFPRLWLEFLAVLTLSVVVILSVLQGRSVTDTFAILGFLAVAAFRLMPSFNRVIGAVQSMRYGFSVIETLYNALNSLSSPPSQEILNPDFVYKKEIQCKHISFQYAGSHVLSLANVSLSIPKGSFVGIIGASGSGKSTLADVLLGLLRPSDGQVLIDNVDIQTMPRPWLSSIGYVPQSIFLTDDSLRRNIAFGVPDDEIDERAVERATIEAQLQQFVAALPAGLDTVVGERGVRMSGGQRQRVGIARALYHNPSVLVLDEATSALDTATEAEIMDSIGLFHGRKTVIVIAHRLGTVAKCDTLYRLEKGRVVSCGTPEEVLKP